LKAREKAIREEARQAEWARARSDRLEMEERWEAEGSSGPGILSQLRILVGGIRRWP